MKIGTAFFLTAILLLSLASSVSAQDAKISVLNPKGTPPPTPLVPMAPRLDTLEGKTIYFVDIKYEGGASLLHEIMAWFTQNIPTAKLVFVENQGSYDQEDAKLYAEIKQKADAVVMAVGH
ncbi:MAG TPA: hypothetical protein VMG30_06570 [Acidobacteriota bacterium]|nr:hypothetical protein [Acidobacteriota bacterium]